MKIYIRSSSSVRLLNGKLQTASHMVSRQEDFLVSTCLLAKNLKNLLSVLAENMAGTFDPASMTMI